MNLLRDVPAGENPPKDVNAVIEVISGSRDKYEYNEKYEAFTLDRILRSSVIFPVDYGFIPQTFCVDNDPLDVMVLSYEPLEVGCMAKVRPVGVLMMEDEKGEDAKILAVLVNDPRFDEVKDIGDIQKHTLKEIREFFETYKRLEPGKWVKFKGWKGKETAKETINNAIALFKKKKNVIK